MKVTPVKTDKITPNSGDIYKVLDRFLPPLNENSVLAVSSKIISTLEKSIVEIHSTDKKELIKNSSDYFYPPEKNKYGVSLTIKRNLLVANAGVDESNGNGYFILWPEDPQKSANAIRSYLKKRFNLKNFGVIITDSKTIPLRWGVTAFAIAYSGIKPLKNYIGENDIFGRKMVFETMSIIDGLASAAGVVMGEGGEQTPLCLIEDLDFVEFTQEDPIQEELQSLRIEPEEDLYSSMLETLEWEKRPKKVKK